ncbi:MAG: ABC transporter ATP-binding protein [Acidobacteriia bacterium]|nr:ABC transporter ATP-binding protein [Terriglobia bacterium]
MLAVSDVAFAYGEHVILHGVSFAVPRGHIVGLLGPNGSGKTTLLRIIAGTLAPQRGRVEIDGVSVTAMSRREIARRISVVPQETHSTFDFTVEDIVLMGRYPHLSAFELEGPDDRAIAYEALQVTGTRALAARTFATLSGGEKQRVVIAGALAQASDALLLDEPTASLDLGAQLDIAALLARLHRDRGTTMVVCTHDLNFAASLCAELVLIRQGRILAQGATADVLTPANVAALYDVRADVAFHAGAKHLTVVPIARA